MTLFKTPRVRTRLSARVGIARALLFIGCVGLLGHGALPTARATETDQFTLPPRPLDDLGPDLGSIVLEIIHAELERLNARIVERTGAPPAATVDPVDEREFLRRIFDETGVGVPETTIERLIRYGKFPGRNVQFKPGITESIYAWTVTPLPLAHTFDCPTIRLYGIDLGTDKLGHIFQQGYDYVIRYMDARDSGADDSAAIASAVNYGIGDEQTFFGIWLTGVYSNADLAGNYAGFKFYRNLFHEVHIGDRLLEPMLRLEDARWIIDPSRDNPELLKPFVTNHMNEAYNPSHYYFSVDLIRRHIRERCASWSAQDPGFDEVSYRAHLEEAKTWFGEPYGWDLPEAVAASLLECFGNPGQSKPAGID